MKESLVLKQKQVDELSQILTAAKTIVVFEYKALSVESLTQLRRALLKSESSAKVYKNNIARRAALKSGLTDLAEHLVGQVAIAYSLTDTVAPAKAVYEFIQAYPDKKIVAGAIDGKSATVSEIETLAKLPNKEGMLQLLAGAMYQPLQRLAIGLNMLAESK